MNKTTLIMLEIIVLAYIISISFYAFTPDVFAMQWNYLGEPSGFISRFWGIFLMPFIMTELLVLFVLIAQVDPFRHVLGRCRKQYDLFVLSLVSFTCYLHILIVLWNGGYVFLMLKAIVPGVAVLVYAFGSLIRTMPYNHYIGITTPWALRSHPVWARTHHHAGQLLKLISLCTLLGYFIHRYAGLFFLVPLLLFSVYIFFYSFVLYRRRISA